MWEFIVGAILGLFAGTFVGILVIALMINGHQEDERLHRETHEQ